MNQFKIVGGWLKINLKLSTACKNTKRQLKGSCSVGKAPTHSEPLANSSCLSGH